MKKTATQRALERAIETHRSREAIYGSDGPVRYGKVMQALFPDGVTLQSADDHTRFHLLTMIAGKLNRYAKNWPNGGHADSMHDIGVYAFLLEGYDEDAQSLAPAKRRSRRPRHRA